MEKSETCDEFVWTVYSELGAEKKNLNLISNTLSNHEELNTVTIVN